MRVPGDDRVHRLAQALPIDGAAQLDIDLDCIQVVAVAGGLSVEEQPCCRGVNGKISAIA
ncbi:putative syringomycin synthetase [Mycobacterium xenopi 3993]|nr:putative syringomycin synthetase [Mycobacterium xenopi 3993]